MKRGVDCVLRKLSVCMYWREFWQVQKRNITSVNKVRMYLSFKPEISFLNIHNLLYLHKEGLPKTRTRRESFLIPQRKFLWGIRNHKKSVSCGLWHTNLVAGRLKVFQYDAEYFHFFLLWRHKVHIISMLTTFFLIDFFTQTVRTQSDNLTVSYLGQ